MIHLFNIVVNNINGKMNITSFLAINWSNTNSKTWALILLIPIFYILFTLSLNILSNKPFIIGKYYDKKHCKMLVENNLLDSHVFLLPKLLCWFYFKYTIYISCQELHSYNFLKLPAGWIFMVWSSIWWTFLRSFISCKWLRTSSSLRLQSSLSFSAFRCSRTWSTWAE